MFMKNILTTPFSVANDMAARVKQRRLEQRITQADLAKKADLPLSTYRHFEQKGQISLRGLLQVAFVLGCLEDFRNVFTQRQWATLDDMLQSTTTKQRVRND